MGDFNDNGITMFSCLVGGNGVGKTTLMHILTASFGLKYVVELLNDEFELVGELDVMHRIYYTPYLHHKTLESVGSNGKDLSKAALIRMDNHGDRGSLDDFLYRHHSENLKRWFKFNHFYRENGLKKIDLPVFNTVELSLQHFDVNIHSPDRFNDTSYQIRNVLHLILDKIKVEGDASEHKILEQHPDKDKDGVNVYFLVRFEYALFDITVGKIASILEKAGNKYLNEGYVPADFNEQLQRLSVRESIEWFLENCGVFRGGKKYKFSNHLVLLNLIDFVRSLVKIESLTESWRIIVVNEAEALRVIELYDAFNNSFVNKWFNYDPTPMFGFEPETKVSSGEQQFLNLFSTLYFHAENMREGIDIDLHSSDSLKGIGHNILLLLDEGDNAFHPQWKKEYVKYLRNIIPLIFAGHSIQIVITSHDPLTLSDLPKNNIVFLEKGPTGTAIGNSTSKRTFGANIADLLRDSFFLEDGQVGSYVAELIKRVVSELRERPFNSKNVQYIESIINALDEPIIKFKLAEMLSEATGSNIFEKEAVEREIKRLENRRNQL